MYTQHFDLRSEPFGLTPDPEFLYPSAGHSEALAALRIGIEGRRGLIVMIGEVGTGKTTLLYSLLPQVSADVKVAYITNTKLSFEEMLAQALIDFGVVTRRRGKRELLARFTEFLLQCAEEQRVAALVIDEAQNLDDECLENLRLLSNVETYAQKLLQIVLVGQPELLEKLDRPNLRQLRERIAVYAEIKALSWRDSYSYVHHRLQQAGGSPDLFTRPALAMLLWQAAGIPRRINILCHNALLFAYGRDEHRVGLAACMTALRSRPRRSRMFRRGKREQARTATATAAPTSRLGTVRAAANAHRGYVVAALAGASLLWWAATLDRSPESTATAQQAHAEVARVSNRAADAPLRQRPQLIHVPAEASLSDLTAQVYGRVDPELIARVRLVNPRIANAERIARGEVLIFPPERAAAQEDSRE